MGDSPRQPFHPAIAQLVQQVTVDDAGNVALPPDAMAACRSRLLTELRDDDVVFLHLLVAWSRFLEESLEPVTSQLYELMQILPQVQAARTKEELHAKARSIARVTEKPASPLTAGLPSPTSTIGVTSRQGRKGR